MASQGASNGSPQGAGNNAFVKFSKGSAQRIAKVVRIVEAGDRNQPGVTFEHPMAAGSPFKVATFTGSWATGTYKTVTLLGGTNTASVYNWCVPSDGDTANTSSTQYVVYGKAGGTNSVVEISYRSTSQTCRMSIAGVDLTELPGYDSAAVQLLGHAAAGGTNCPTLTWYSVTTCATSA